MWWRSRNRASPADPAHNGSAGRGSRRLALRSRRDSRWSDERELQSRIRQLLRDLDVRPPLRVPELCAALGEHRGRHLEVQAYPLPVDGPQGLWFETPVGDVVLYQSATTALHQDHIILHELGHILADHPSNGVAGQWAALLPGLKPEAIRRVLTRCTYDDAHEREAELVATIIMEWASVLDALPPSSEDPALRRIHDALGDRQGWL